jgi:hypothetical protein
LRHNFAYTIAKCDEYAKSIMRKKSWDMKKVMQETESLRVAFEGNDEISLDTLNTSLNAVLGVLQLIAERSMSKDESCKFIVKSVQRGSFVIDISVIQDLAPMITAGLLFGNSLLTILIKILETKKHLKGQPPKQIIKNKGNITIVNVDNSNITISKEIAGIYAQDNEIEKLTSQLSEASTKDASRTAIKIVQTNEKGNEVGAVRLDEKDLALTSHKVDIEKALLNPEEEVNTVWLNIKKMYFYGDAKWDFVLNVGNKPTITADIEDKDFLTKVHNGDISVSAVMRILVDLIVRTKKDENNKVLGKPTYIISKVKEIKSPTEEPPQMKLNLE